MPAERGMIVVMKRLCAVLAVLAMPHAALALDGTPLDTLDAVHAACASARDDGPRTLYVLTVAARRWRFLPRAAGDAPLVVDSRHNLPALEGTVAIQPAFLESIAFPVDDARAARLVAAAREGASLRVGFYLGLDDRQGQLCIVRSAAGVTLVRAELAYAEVLDAHGDVVARQDTERMRTEREDAAEARATTGGAPLLGAPSAGGGATVPTSWGAALAVQGRGTLATQLARCRTSDDEADLSVRLVVALRTGDVRSGEVELSAGAGDREASCVARTLAASLVLPPGDAHAGDAATVALSVPVHFAHR